MTFRGDDRAVSTVVGAVLIFGILILALGVYQAQIVPTENEGVEYRHSQDVQNQMQDLRNSLVGTAQTGDGAPVSVKLGTRYPLRTFAVNPPPVYGTLESVPLSQASKVTISNVEATNAETADYLNDTLNPLTFDTKGLAYNGNYNEFQSGPDAVRYEHGALYNDYEAGDINLTAGLLIDGNDITVVTLNASDSFSESGIESVSVDPKPLSAPHRATEVENSGGTLTLELPTNASRRYWVDTYEGRPNVADVSLSETASGNVTTIEFVDGTYNLRMAAVGVGDELEKPNAKYLTVVDGSGTDRVTVEARDRYNNPVNGVTVRGPGSDLVDASVTTGPAGRAAFEPTSSGADSPVNVTIAANNASATPYQNATLFFGTSGSGSGDGTGDEGGSNINPNEPGSVVLRDEVFDGNKVQLTVNNTGNNTRTIQQVRYNFYSEDTQNGKTNPPGYVVINGETVDVRGPYTDIGNVSFPPGETPLTMCFYQDQATTNPFSVSEGDFFVFSVRYDTGAATYFVGPESGTVSESCGGSGGGGGSGTSASQVTLSNAGTAGSDSAVSFDVTNNGADVTLTRLAVNSTTDKQASQINGTPTVAADTTGIYSGTITITGNSVDTSDVPISNSSTTELTLKDFKKNKNNAVDMSGDNVEVTLFFLDGSSKTVTLSV